MARRIVITSIVIAGGRAGEMGAHVDQGIHIHRNTEVTSISLADHRRTRHTPEHTPERGRRVRGPAV